MYKFVGAYLYNDGKQIGTIKDNKTINIIEDLLNGVDNMKKNYKLEFRTFVECDDIDEAINLGQAFAKEMGVELVGVTEVIYVGDVL